jgi:eukaryotic-like serine/threonine-protein kinase
VDARTDVFSFGAVLYELLTGERAFRGETKLSTMAAVVEKDPAPMGAGIPVPVERMVWRCLRKDPTRRWQNMADLQMSLEELRDDTDSGRLSPVAGTRERSRSWLAYASILVLAAACGLLWNRMRPGSPAAPPTVRPLTTYPGTEIQPSFSPDGNHVVFVWDGDNQDNYDIYVKRIGPGAPLRLTFDPAIDSYPAWSPDGNWIAFLRSREPAGALQTAAPALVRRFSILVVPALGGAERKIGESGGMGLTWSGDSRWLITTDADSRELCMVSFETGERKI